MLDAETIHDRPDWRLSQSPDFLSQGPSQLRPTTSLTHPRASWSDFCAYFSTWRNGSVLFATMASWFLVDFAFYGLGLNNTTILAVVGYSSGSDVYRILLDAAVGNLILVCAGAIPGYLLSVLTVDTLWPETYPNQWFYHLDSYLLYNWVRIQCP